MAALSLAQVTPNNAGAKNVGAGNGAQFITGGCVSDADCSSACCSQVAATGDGVCSAEAASLQNGKTGCGFNDPNAAAVRAPWGLLSAGVLTVLYGAALPRNG